VGTLYREALGELVIRYDSIYKIAWGQTWDIYTILQYKWACLWKIGLLLSNETCFHNQIMFTYSLPVFSHGYNCKRLQTTFKSICVWQSLLITHTMMAIFLIMTSNFVIADMVHLFVVFFYK